MAKVHLLEDGTACQWYMCRCASTRKRYVCAPCWRTRLGAGRARHVGHAMWARSSLVQRASVHHALQAIAFVETVIGFIANRNIKVVILNLGCN